MPQALLLIYRQHWTCFSLNPQKWYWKFKCISFLSLIFIAPFKTLMYNSNAWINNAREGITSREFSWVQKDNWEFVTKSKRWLCWLYTCSVLNSTIRDYFRIFRSSSLINDEAFILAIDTAFWDYQSLRGVRLLALINYSAFLRSKIWCYTIVFRCICIWMFANESNLAYLAA